MDKHEAAQVLGVAFADVVYVGEAAIDDGSTGTLVRLCDGGTRMITGDGFFAVDDHPATAHLRRFGGLKLSGEGAEAPEEAEPADESEPKPRAPRSRKAAK